MPLPWQLILSNVPWKDVLANAPKIADGAKKMWGSLGRRQDGAADTAIPAADLPARLSAQEAAIRQLQEQMLASGELIRALSEQNTQLVAQIETHRQRARRQSWAIAATALAAGLALLLAWQPNLLEFFA